MGSASSWWDDTQAPAGLKPSCSDTTDAAPLGRFLRDFQPFAPPDPLDPLVIHSPARIAEQGSHPAIAVAAMLPGQFDDVGGQPATINIGLNQPLQKWGCPHMTAPARLEHHRSDSAYHCRQSGYAKEE
jgi:hypothetical protein